MNVKLTVTGNTGYECKLVFPSSDRISALLIIHTADDKQQCYWELTFKPPITTRVLILCTAAEGQGVTLVLLFDTAVYGWTAGLYQMIKFSCIFCLLGRRSLHRNMQEENQPKSWKTGKWPAKTRMLLLYIIHVNAVALTRSEGALKRVEEQQHAGWKHENKWTDFGFWWSIALSRE